MAGAGAGISGDSISLNPDAVLRTTVAILETERALRDRSSASARESA